MQYVNTWQTSAFEQESRSMSSKTKSLTVLRLNGISYFKSKFMGKKKERNGYYKFSVGGKTVEVVTIKFSKHFLIKIILDFCRFCVFFCCCCSLLYPQHLKHCLAHGCLSINVTYMNSKSTYEFQWNTMLSGWYPSLSNYSHSPSHSWNKSKQVNGNPNP